MRSPKSNEFPSLARFMAYRSAKGPGPNCPALIIPLIELDAPVLLSVISDKSPVLIAFPFDAIVIICISPLLVPAVPEPPATKPLVGEFKFPALYPPFATRSPKSIALPSVPIST